MLWRMATMVHEALESTVAKFQDKPALRVKRNGTWQTTTWSSYGRDVRRAARGLISLGVRPGEGISLIGQNSPEWLIANVGAIFAAAVPAGIYTTSSPAQVGYITHHCNARVAFADTATQVAKFAALPSGIPNLEVVVQMTGKPAFPTDVGMSAKLRVMGWDEFLELGDTLPDSAVDERLNLQSPDGVCTLIYTSGTTGEPKAVMLTHTNLVWTAGSLLPTLSLGQNDITLSYLPLSHVAEQILTIHGPMAMGSLVYFAESIDKLGENLAEVRPTLFMGVPRVWEKIQSKMMAAGANAPFVRRKLVAWARKTGLEGGNAEQRGERKPVLFPLAQKLVFNKVRQRLGLDRARLCITSAAPISRETLDFFLALGIPVLEAYGMSECTGPATYSPPGRFRTGKCGICIPGAEIKLAEDGELCIRGKHVFKGYLNDAEATKEALDADGWLHSGDIGTIDSEGFVQITDRKKDILITAGGENIAPQVIESRLKAIPVVAQAVVIGDRRKYLSALLTLDSERLLADAKLAGSAARTASEAAICADFRRHLERQIASINDTLARVQTIKRFAILPADLSIETGELTPTMKVKRKVVNEKFAREIESLYLTEA